jgi:hypothetical protein
MLYLTIIYPIISIIMIIFKSGKKNAKSIKSQSIEKEIYKTALFFS